ncbi:hypothetical protein EIN_335230 [Entamoeba invadens IP1]|uniref:Uncharacterized protein n=1 Tax=Entamoeba invadens IP1 TaxID=370355 RepID=L7FM77_ENTIV|nr:hypothetical protein EIN_335230 [Entamoeba invadens IP1]ELP88551.1 hypothetical protein EIN_335230 [Entamoeba invadens IP1]|eukprot:XP_004255322.1 hypothetical protein EIN_335230 [Entamoeba invadens IP1]
MSSEDQEKEVSSSESSESTDSKEEKSAESTTSTESSESSEEIKETNDTPTQLTTEEKLQPTTSTQKSLQEDDTKNQKKQNPTSTQEDPAYKYIYNVFVTRLPKEITHDTFLEFFKEYNPTSCRLPLDASHQSKGFGFLEFATEADKNRMLANKDRMKKFRGHKILIQESETKKLFINKKCFICGEVHDSANCPHKNDQNFSKQDRPCFKCGWPGHISKDCPY